MTLSTTEAWMLTTVAAALVEEGKKENGPIKEVTSIRDAENFATNRLLIVDAGGDSWIVTVEHGVAGAKVSEALLALRDRASG